MIYSNSDKDGGERAPNNSECSLSKGKPRKSLRAEFNRRIHNYIEKKRKDKINIWINRIADILPQRVAKKESKNDILERAYCHMLHLREINDRIIYGNIDKVRGEKIKELKKQIKKLQQINAAYYKLFKVFGISLDDLPSDLLKISPNIFDSNIFSQLNSDLRPKFSDVESDDSADTVSCDNLSDETTELHDNNKKTKTKKRKHDSAKEIIPSGRVNNSTVFVVPTSDQKASKISQSNGSQIQIRPSPNVSVLGNNQLAIQANNVGQGPIILGSTILAPPQQTLLMSNGQLLSIMNQPQPTLVYSPGSGFVLASAPVSNQATNLTVPTVQSNINNKLQIAKKKPKTTTTIEPVAIMSPKTKPDRSPKANNKSSENALDLNLTDDGEDMEDESPSNISKKTNVPSSALTEISSNRSIFTTEVQRKSQKEKMKRTPAVIEKTSLGEKAATRTTQKNKSTNQEHIVESDRDRSQSEKKTKSVPTSDISVNQMDYHLMNQIDEYIRSFSPPDFENHTGSPRYSSPLARNSGNAGILASDSNEIIGANENCIAETTLTSQNKSPITNVVISSEISKDLTPGIADNFANMDHSHQIDSVLLQPNSDLASSQNFSQQNTIDQTNEIFHPQTNSESELQKRKSQNPSQTQTPQGDIHLQKQKSYQDAQIPRNRASNANDSVSRSSSNPTSHSSSRENLSQQTFLPYSAEALIRQQPLSNNVPSNENYHMHPSVDTNLEFNTSSSVARDNSGNRTSISYSAERLLHSSPGSGVQNDNSRSKNGQSKRRQNMSSNTMINDQFSLFDTSRPEESIGSNLSQHPGIQHSSLYRSSPIAQTTASEQTHHQNNHQMLLISQQQASRQYSDKSPVSNQLHQHQPQHSTTPVNQHWQEQQTSTNQTMQTSSNSQRSQTRQAAQNQRPSHQNTHQASRRQSSPTNNNVLPTNNRNLFNPYPYTPISETARSERNLANTSIPYSTSSSSTNEQNTFHDNSSVQSSFQPPFATPSNYPSIRRPSNNNPFVFSDHLTTSSFNSNPENLQYSRSDQSSSTSQVPVTSDSHRPISSSNCEIPQAYLINYPSTSIQHSNSSTVFSTSSSFPPIISSSASTCFDNNSYLASARPFNPPNYPPQGTSISAQFVESSTTSSANQSREINKTSKASSTVSKQSKSSSAKTATKKVTNKNQSRTTHSQESRVSSSAGSYSPMGANFTNVGHTQDVNRPSLDPALTGSMSGEHMRNDRPNEVSDHLLRPQSQNTITLNLPVNNIAAIPAPASSRPSTASSHIAPVGHSSSFLPNFSLTNILTDMGPNLNENLGFPPIKFPASNHVLPHTNTGGHLPHTPGLQPNSIESTSVSMGQSHQNFYGHSRISASRHNSMPFSPLLPTPNSTHATILHDAKIGRGMKPR